MNQILPNETHPAGSSGAPLSPVNEQATREWLAEYFLSPPDSAETPEQSKQRRLLAVRAMSALETDAIIQSAGINRPLKYGDVTGLLESVLEAGAKILENNGIILEYTPPRTAVYTSAEPRLLQLTLARMLRTAAISYREGKSQKGEWRTINSSILLREHTITVKVADAQGCVSADVRTSALMHETARVHKGMAVVSGGTAAFSMRRELSGAIGLFNVPSPRELLSDLLSPVRIGMISV